MDSSLARPPLPSPADRSSSVYNLLSSVPSDRRYDTACSAPDANGRASLSHAANHLISHLTQVSHPHLDVSLLYGQHGQRHCYHLLLLQLLA